MSRDPDGVVRLPADHRRMPGWAPVVAGEAAELPLPPRLDGLAAELGTDADTVLLAVFGALLDRYTDQTELVFATGRARPIRLSPPAGADLPTLVRHVARRLAGPSGAEPCAAGPSGAGPLGGGSEPPPAVPVEFRTVPAGDLACGGLPSGGEVRVCVRRTAGLAVEVAYDASLFTAATIRRLVGHYRVLLHAAVADPDRAVSGLPVLTEEEQRLMLLDWNATGTELPGAAGTLHAAFARQARWRPHAVALVDGSTELTFARVDAAADRLARRLRAAGVDRGDRVGLCLDRSADLLVALLAVLKAGAAYVPLDPTYPAARLRRMVDTARCAALVCAGPPLAGLDAVPVPAIRLDAAGADPACAPDGGAGPDDLCYVMFTSGSTGSPKGIALRHAGVLNNLADLNSRFGVGPGDAILALSSPSFDMSVYDFLGVTIAGGTVVVPSRTRARDPSHWTELLERHQITVWNSAPPLLDLLVNQAERTGARLDRLRLALVGGDWIPVDLPDRLHALAPGLRFISLGGATEASIHSTIYEVAGGDPGWVSIPYGRPMANQRVYVLDRARQPVPIGVPGELHLAGAGLARGYLGDPAQTAARFFRWSYGPVTGERLYRTGDLARFRSDGQLELLGRIDFQVKVHGVRIETAEVEAALSKHPAVTACVVAARSIGAGQQLVGYVVPESGGSVAVAGLRAHAAALLPASMVPAVFVVVDRLPLSPNGKVDRASLPALAGELDGEPPADQSLDRWEQLVLEAWRETLGTERIDPDSDFFALGGDSFAAMRAVQRIDPHLPVAELFGSPTVRGLAARLRHRAVGKG